MYLRLENPADVEPLHLVDMADFYSELRTGVSGDELKQVSVFPTAHGNAHAPSGDSQVIYVDGSIATYAWFNQRPAARERTLYNIGLTLFICVLLTLGSLQFSSDAQNLVLRPIEEMVSWCPKVPSLFPLSTTIAIRWTLCNAWHETQRMKAGRSKAPRCLKPRYTVTPIPP